MKPASERKVASWTLAKQLGKPAAEIVEVGERVTEPEERAGRDVRVWYAAAAADRIRQALRDPLTVARRYQAVGIHVARNPKWMFCSIEGQHGKLPVAIPRRLVGRLERKRFTVERIEDINGVTWRHAALATNNNSNGYLTRTRTPVA